MADSVKIIPLGGLSEIGMNIMAYECGDNIIVVDCGLMFPEDFMPGVDLVLPDVSYLKDNIEKVKAFVITHGHEDHIGALPFILKDITVPVYGTKFTLGLIESKLSEHEMLQDINLIEFKPRDIEKIGPFEIEFIRVAHSIVDCVSLAITTPQGVIIHTGDFKIDTDPIDGEFTDFETLKAYGDKGVRLLLSDSTNVERTVRTKSESSVTKALKEEVESTKGKVIVAAFSSNIHRVQQVIDVAKECGRKVALCGRSMVKNSEIARRLGYLKIPDSVMIDIKDAKTINSSQLLVLSTGSQGEPLSALMRISHDTFDKVKLQEGDKVILSSRSIPGHERSISKMMSNLFRRGAEVVYEKTAAIHVSGHASQDELTDMMEAVRPERFIPIHGEYHHLVKHKRLFESTMNKFGFGLVIENGDVAELSDEGLHIADHISVGKVFVDGKGVGDVGDLVLKDRRHLSKDGMIIVIVVIDMDKGKVTYGPDLITRGLTYEEEQTSLLEAAKVGVCDVLDGLTPEELKDIAEVTEDVRISLRRFFNRRLKRKPVIFPLVIEL